MKKLLFWLSLFCLVALFTKPTFAFAENKVGVNIGDHFSDFGKAVNLVGDGGWVVIMACPGDGDKIAKLVTDYPKVNLVIRGHYPSQIPTEENNKLAKLWTATLASIPSPNKIYFMPWNEPNHENEGGGPTAGNVTYQYSQFLKSQLESAGILGSKIILLSPMVDKLNDSFVNGSFFTNPGGKSGFYSLFNGSSINEYDQFNPGPCTAAAPQNNCKYNEIGIPGPYYSLESGVAGTCTPPCYRDSELRQMLETSWNKWSTDPNFKMFAIFSYDPHRAGEWDIFESGLATENYLRNIRQTGCCTQAITPVSSSTGLTACPGKLNSFYINSESECTECGSMIGACKPIVEPVTYGEEKSKDTISINEEAKYSKRNDACITSNFSGKISITNFEIPFVNNLNKFFLGPYVDNPKARLAKPSPDPMKDSGVLEKLLSSEYQDKLKRDFLVEIIARASESKGRYKFFRIEGMSPQQILTKFDSGATDPNFINVIWPQVPLFANEETEGEVVFSGSGFEKPDNIVKTAVPEVYRLNKASELFAKIVGTKNNSVLAESTQNGQVLQATACVETAMVPEDKFSGETKTGYGENICTKETLQVREKPIEGTRVFINDAGEDCAPQGGCDINADSSPSDVENRCCGNKGKCHVKYDADGNPHGECDDGAPNRCEGGYCRGGGSDFVSGCCIPSYTEKTKNFEDIPAKLNSVNRVPYLDKIEENVLGAFRALLPNPQSSDTQTTETLAKPFKKVAGESRANVKIEFDPPQTNGNSFRVDNVDTQVSLLFHNLGTIINVKDFFAKKVVWPFRIASASDTPGTLDYTIDYKNPNISISNLTKTNVIQSVKSSWSGSKIEENWDLVSTAAISHGWNPAFVIALWIEESGASGVDAWDLGCLGGNKNNIQSQLDCLFDQTVTYSNGPFDQFMCMYSEGKPAPCTFSTNPNFTRNLKYWYDRLTQ